jgi:hypothetical protein
MRIILLNESVLEVRDDKFVSILKQMIEKTSNRKIFDLCRFFMDSIKYRYDIETNYNNITVKSPDKIVFTSNEKYQKGKYESIEMSVGRFISKVVKLNQSHPHINRLKISDRDIELFVYEFAAVLERESEVNNLKVVTGEDIRKYYSERNYEDRSRGSLGRSCMSNPEKGKFLDIYVDNPENISMVVILSNDGKVKARALIWKMYSLENKKWYYFLDRVYYTLTYQEGIINDWFKKNYEDILEKWQLRDLNVVVPLMKCEYKFFPYLDTIQYFYKKRGIFKNIPYPFNTGECFLSYSDSIFGFGLKSRLFKSYRLADTDGGYRDN